MKLGQSRIFGNGRKCHEILGTTIDNLFIPPEWSSSLTAYFFLEWANKACHYRTPVLQMDQKMDLRLRFWVTMQ